MLRAFCRLSTIPGATNSLRRIHTSNTLQNALKVAFFGSDSFSIPSLLALSKLSKTQPELIQSIDVIAKHPKRAGRNLELLADVPIAQTAQQEGLNVIRAETNGEILNLIKNEYSLAIAVSYGKLIPEKFIKEIPYSLNVHPSLLPKYSGASPLQYTLLNQDEFTGVTIQTLHPTEFDKGKIVDQCEPVPVEKFEKLDHLTDRLAHIGARMLEKVIISGSFKNPQFESNYEYSYAKKIPHSMKEISWEDYTADQLVARYNVLGPLYSFKETKVKKRRSGLIHDFKRVIFFDIEMGDDLPGFKPGEFSIENEAESGKQYLQVQTKKGSIIPKSLQMEYQAIEDADTFVKRLQKRIGDTAHVFSAKVPLE